MRKSDSYLLIWILLSLLSILPEEVKADPRDPGVWFGLQKKIIKIYDQASQREIEVINNEILVKFKERTSGKTIASLHSQLKTEIISEIPELGLQRLKLPDNLSVSEAINRYRQHVDVEMTEPNYIAHQSIIPNDHFYNQQWYLPHINAEQAWDIETGSQNVVIGVLDTGVDTDHADLASKIWTNPDEIPNNNIDDDNNGFIDDVHGWDFVTIGHNAPADNDPNPEPNGSNDNEESDQVADDGCTHGTHVAGIIGAETNTNNVGVAGVGWGITIMPVRVGNDEGTFDYGEIIDGMLYACRNGAKIINCSFGGPFSESIGMVICYLYNNYDCIFVAAAGNDGINLDNTLQSPVCNDNNQNMVLGVAAIDQQDQRSVFSHSHSSNFSIKYVDVSSPGSNIYNAVYYNPAFNFNLAWESYNGTSMAAPIVAGVAGLIRSRYPDWNNRKVMDTIINTAVNIDRLNPDFIGHLGHGRIDANAALINELKASRLVCSAQPPTLKADGTSKSTISAAVSSQNGDLIFTATDEITFSLTSGSTSGLLIGNHSVNAVNGVATITLQSTIIPGNVTIQATSPGLISGTTTVNVYQNPTEVGGTIERDTTWPLSGSPYLVTRDITINSGVILTLEAGTTVLFNRDRDLFVRGALVAKGTANAQINFTTSETNPFPRAWGGIKFYDSGLDHISILQYCTISYGGQGDYGNLDSPLILNGYANPTITNTNLHHNNRNSVDLEDGTYTSDINLNITAVPYTIRRDITISSGATMTLQPGVIIKMDRNSDLEIQGGLNARGTAQLPIRMTSIRDDSRGGDTNGDGVTSGTPGDWGGILFESSANDATCQLDFCEIYYGGQGDYGNQDCPIKLHPYVNPTITNCILKNNKLNGVDLKTGSYASDITLDITRLPYSIRGDLEINEGACLKILPGVTLKFSGNADIYINGGCLAQGTNSGHIIFTSLRDDAHGGDTNGDGVTSGSTGDWGGIKFNGNVMDSKCHLNNCDILYAGQGGYGNVGYPIALNGFANPTLTNISLVQNTRNGVDIASGNYASDFCLNILNIPLMIRGDLVVESSATLTIEPGVILKFESTCDLYIKGALIASGEPNQQIIFTSLKDDSYGGDTNGDGASAGSKGDWGGIQFYDAVIDQSSILEYCKIRYAGSGGYGNNDSPLVLTGLANPTIKNCILQENTRNGINLLAQEYSSDFYLDIISLPYMVRGDLVVNSPAKMTIQPGVTLKLDGGCDFWINGSLQAVGTPSQPITFTSIKDDSIGGNTNGDGVSVGTPGDWGGVSFRDASDDNLCIMDYVHLCYAGCGGYGNLSAPLTFDNANSKIQRVMISKSRSHGAICYNSASPDFGGGNQASLGQNKFLNFKGVTNKYAFYNDGTAAIYARNNYWETNDSLQIEKLIYDKIDQNSKGRVNFYPFQHAADILAPQIKIIHPNGGEAWPLNSQQVITWSAVDDQGISKILFHLSRDGGLTYSEISVLDSNPGILPWYVTGPSSNSCRLKIQAFDFSGNNGLDLSDRNFSISDTTSAQNHPPSIPNLLLPINGEEALPDDYLVWTQSSDLDVGDVIRYTLELDNNPDFSSPEIRQSGISGDATSSGQHSAPMIVSANAVYVQLSTLQNYSNLKDDSTYYWRVQAVDQSAAASDFTIGNAHFRFNKFNTAPQAVLAGFSPKDGLEVRSQKPEISWHPAKDADLSDHPGTLRYSLHLADNTGFANFLAYSTGTGLNTFEVPNPLTENAKWFYRVQTMDDEGLVSAWSAAQNFWVNAIDEPPAAFALQFPANNSTVTTDSVTFSWANTFDVDPNDRILFTFELSLQQNFSENLISAPNQTDSCLKIGMNGLAKTAYFWRVKAIDSDGLVTWGSQSETTPWSFVLAAAAVSDHSAGVPTTFALFQNYPNPFNPETTIRYQLPLPGHTQLIIYNTLGQEIRTMFDGEQPAGFYQFRWDGYDHLGFKVGSGIYICQLKTDRDVAVKKMVVIQ